MNFIVALKKVFIYIDFYFYSFIVAFLGPCGVECIEHCMCLCLAGPVAEVTATQCVCGHLWWSWHQGEDSTLNLSSVAPAWGKWCCPSGQAQWQHI